MQQCWLILCTVWNFLLVDINLKASLAFCIWLLSPSQKCSYCSFCIKIWSFLSHHFSITVVSCSPPFSLTVTDSTNTFYFFSSHSAQSDFNHSPWIGSCLQILQIRLFSHHWSNVYFSPSIKIFFATCKCWLSSNRYSYQTMMLQLEALSHLVNLVAWP